LFKHCANSSSFFQTHFYSCQTAISLIQTSWILLKPWLWRMCPNAWMCAVVLCSSDLVSYVKSRRTFQLHYNSNAIELKPRTGYIFIQNGCYVCVALKASSLYSVPLKILLIMNQLNFCVAIWISLHCFINNKRPF